MLRQLVAKYGNPTFTKQMLEKILEYILKQQEVLKQFEDRTAPATALATFDQTMADHQREVFDAQKELLPRLATVNIDCDEPGPAKSTNLMGGWGHSYAFPMERYVTDRVSKDQQTINTQYMQVIDQLRRELAVILNQMAGMDIVNVPSLQ